MRGGIFFSHLDVRTRTFRFSFISCFVFNEFVVLLVWFETFIFDYLYFQNEEQNRNIRNTHKHNNNSLFFVCDEFFFLSQFQIHIDFTPIFFKGKITFMRFSHSHKHQSVISFFSFLFDKKKILILFFILKSIINLLLFLLSGIVVSKPREKTEQSPFHTIYHSKWWIFEYRNSVLLHRSSLSSNCSKLLSLSRSSSSTTTSLYGCMRVWPKRISISLP